MQCQKNECVCIWDGVSINSGDIEAQRSKISGSRLGSISSRISLNHMRLKISMEAKTNRFFMWMFISSLDPSAGETRSYQLAKFCKRKFPFINFLFDSATRRPRSEHHLSAPHARINLVTITVWARPRCLKNDGNCERGQRWDTLHIRNKVQATMVGLGGQPLNHFLGVVGKTRKEVTLRCLGKTEYLSLNVSKLS